MEIKQNTKSFYRKDGRFGASAELYELAENDIKQMEVDVQCGPGDSVYWFSRLFVHKNLRNRGYATELMKECCQWADEKNVIILNAVRPYGDMGLDAATRFYKKFGFKLIEESQENGESLMIR